MNRGELKQVVSEQVLQQLALDRTERITEYKRRRPRVLQKRIAEAEAPSFLESGWTERRKLKGGRVVMEKLRPHDEILENRLWCVLYQLGFTELNMGRRFNITVSSGGQVVTKQIDVFAKLDEIVVVAECKSSAKKQQRPLQKDIGEFASLQRPIANTLRRHYGQQSKLKIV